MKDKLRELKSLQLLEVCNWQITWRGIKLMTTSMQVTNTPKLNYIRPAQHVPDRA